MAIASCNSFLISSRECVRETDLLARYGGEEFVVVMPQTDLAGACILIERTALPSGKPHGGYR